MSNTLWTIIYQNDSSDTSELVERMRGLLPCAGLTVRALGRKVQIRTPTLEATLVALRDEFEIVDVAVHTNA